MFHHGSNLIKSKNLRINHSWHELLLWNQWKPYCLYNIFSKICRFISPTGITPCLSHSFVAQWSAALNSSTSFTFNVLLFTTDLSTDCSTVTNSSDVTASFVCISITFQHRSAKCLSFNFRAYGRMQKTLDAFRFSRRYSAHFCASEDTIYLFAKQNTCITLLPVKFTLSVYKKRNNSNRLS